MVKRRAPEVPRRNRRVIAAGLAAYVAGFEAQTEGRVRTTNSMGRSGRGVADTPAAIPHLHSMGRTGRMWIHGWNAGVVVDFMGCECNG